MDFNMRDLVKLGRKGKSGWIDMMEKNEIGSILADVVNAQRLDNKRLAQEYDLDMEVKQLSSEKASESIADVIEGDMDTFAQIMDELQQQRDEILREALSDEEYEKYYKQRESSLDIIGDPQFHNDEKENNE